MKKQELEFELRGEFIELIKLLKLMQIAESGGQAQLFVENGEVFLNGEEEHRKRAKLRRGDVIELFDLQITIK
jgi:ribosome-associated protein